MAAQSTVITGSVINGTAGNDTLTGTSGADTIYGGKGNDVLYGGYNVGGTYDALNNFYDSSYSDTFVFNSGDGEDVILDRQSDALDQYGFKHERIVFQDVSSASVSFSTTDGIYLDISYTDIPRQGYPIDKVRIFYPTCPTYRGFDSTSLETIEFAAEGIVWSGDALRANILSRVQNYMTDNHDVGNNPLVGQVDRMNVITAYEGNDWLQGGNKNDLLKAGLGDDTSYAGDGQDTIYGEDGNDALFGEGGNDTIYGGAGNDWLSGGIGDDNIMGETGNDQVIGGDGNDVLDGWSGNDWLQGDAGNDVLQAGSGDDTNYAGIGDDTIYGECGSDALFGEGGNDLLVGGEGNDWLNGGEGSDTLAGDEGNDRLIGGTGADSYWFTTNQGVDVVDDVDGNSANIDRINFSGSVVSNQLWFEKYGNNLNISIVGTASVVVVLDWYLGASHQIEEIAASDGKVLQNSEVNALVSAMAAFSPPAPGQTTLPTNYQSALNLVLAANWS